MKNKTQKQEVPTIEIFFPDADKILADLERGIAECRQRAIEHMAEEYGVSIEQANRMADEISEQAYVAYTNKRKKITAENMDHDRITRWKPFLYCFVDYEEKRYKVTFTCPRCGGHNCEKLGDLDKYNFWSGHYRCTDCGETRDKGGPFCYYSDCFIKEEEKPAAVQLTLF